MCSLLDLFNFLSPSHLLPHLPEPQNFSLSPTISLLFICTKLFSFSLMSFPSLLVIRFTLKTFLSNPFHFFPFSSPPLFPLSVLLYKLFFSYVFVLNPFSLSHHLCNCLCRWGVVYRTDCRFPGQRLCDLQKYGWSLHHEDRD